MTQMQMLRAIVQGLREPLFELEMVYEGPGYGTNQTPEFQKREPGHFLTETVELKIS